MKKIYFLLFFVLFGGVIFASSRVGNFGGFNPPAAASFCPQLGYIIQKFTIQQTAPTSTLTAVGFTTTGTYAATDVTNFKLLRNTSNTFATATTISTLPGSAAGLHTFTIAPADALTAGVNYYYWITIDVPGTATAGNTIAVNAINSANITVSAGPKFGTSLASTTQTINGVPTGVTATASPNPVCNGSNLTLTGTATGGVSYNWVAPAGSSFGGSVALNPPAFAVTGVDAGVYTLTATNGCGSATATTAAVTINALPPAITGTSMICIGTSMTFTDAAGAGTWISTSPIVASITSPGGVITANTVGSTTIIFTDGSTGCSISTLVNVTTTLPSITGATVFCQYSTTSLSDVTTGGTWSTSNTVVATVDAVTGLVSGLAAGTDTVTYSTGGCNTTIVVTVNPVPVPGPILGINEICVETGTLLTDTPIAGLGVTTSWVSGNPFIATIDAFGFVTGVSAGLVVMTYNVTNACGTTGATFMMTIDRPVTPIYGDTIVCEYNVIGLYDSVLGGTWSASNGNATVSSIGIVTGITAGHDIITYTDSNACGISFTTYIITVGIPADWGVITGPDVVCVGSSVTMSETVSGGVWQTSLGYASISSTGVVTGVSSGIDSIKYVLMAVCGPSHATHIIHVDLFETPLVSISANPGLVSCETIPSTYTAHPVYGGTAPTYMWDVNGAFVSTASSYSYSPANGDHITCIMTTNYPCAVVPTASAFVIDTVYPKVIPTIQVIAGTLGDTICAGTLDTFFANTTNGGLSPIMNWSVNGTFVSAGTSLIYTPSNYDVVSCTLLSSARCAIPDSVVSHVVMTVDSMEVPTVNVMINPSDSVCTGTLVNFTADYTYGGRHPHFVWIKNGVNVGTGVSYTYPTNNLDTVSCEYFSTSTCAIPSVVFSTKTLMHTYPVVNPSISVIPTPGLTVNYGQNDTLMAFVSNAGPSPQYQWIVNGAIVPGATSYKFILNSVISTYTVTCIVTGSGNCPVAENSETLVINHYPSEVRQISSLNCEYILSPNPNKGEFTLYGSSVFDDELKIEITNIVGQTVYTNKVQTQNGLINQRIILANNFSNGIYMLHIYSAQENKVIKFSLDK